MINRSVNINIGGEERSIKFTLAALEELESKLPDGNVFLFMRKNQWSIGEIISACHCAINAAGVKNVSRKTIEEWVTDYATENENGINDLRLRLLAAIGMSGLLGGDHSAFENILTALDSKDEEPGKQ